MILKGSQRSGGLKLAAHLMNDRDNDHVEIHELRGFTSETLNGAFQEADAIAKGTRCQQFLFSLSLSPPETEQVSISDFENANEQAEERLGLQRQRRQRQQLHEKLEVRRIQEVKLRQDRFRTGFKGLWDRIRGEHRQIKELNERDAWKAHLRDRTLEDELVFGQLDERQHLKHRQAVVLLDVKDQLLTLEQDRDRFNKMRNNPSSRVCDGPIINR